MTKCDNFSQCHDAVIIGEDVSAILVFCKNCRAMERIGKDINGNPEHRAYSNWFKRDFIQADHPLYYRYQGAKHMKIV